MYDVCLQSAQYFPMAGMVSAMKILDSDKITQRDKAYLWVVIRV